MGYYPRCGCPICGDVHKRIPVYSHAPSSITWRDELSWIQRQMEPVWGGPLKRGEELADANAKFLIENGLISQIGTEGYVISKKGLSVLKGYIKP